MRRFNLDKCNEIASRKNGKCLSNEYKNNKLPLEWMCEKGHDWYTTYSVINSGSWCPHCIKTIFTLEKCQELAIKRYGKCLSTEYKNNRESMLWECKLKHVWKAPLSNVFNNNHWCHKCAVESKKLGIGVCKQVALQREGVCLSEIYEHANALMSWKCKKEHTWQARFADVKSGSWCPACAGNQSKAELEIYNYVKISYPDALSNQPGIIKSKRMKIDVYVPSLKKAIEYDGWWCHKGKIALKSGAHERDARKDRECEELGIKLLRISDKYYLKNKEKVRKEILEFLNNS